MLRWFLSLHSPTYNYTLSPEKVALAKAEKEKRRVESGSGFESDSDNEDNGDVLPVFDVNGKPEDMSSVPPAPAAQTDTTESQGPLPPTFTPSIKKTLNKAKLEDDLKPPPLPSGLSASILKSRLDTKKKIK
jgi:DNA-3-methyladenine glycosylase II